MTFLSLVQFTSQGPSQPSAWKCLWAHPIRAFLLAVVGCLLTWLVVSKSLPVVWAEKEPELAARILPEHPAVLLARAEERRKRLMALVSSEMSDERGAVTDGPQTSGAARFVAPDLSLDEDAVTATDRKTLQEEIHALASEVLRRDPLNARAFMLLAEVSEEQEVARKYLEAAFKLSRREETAAFWLLNESFQKKDTPSVLNYADVIFRTKSQLAPYVVSYLSQLATDQESRGLLVKKLATNPTWRGSFFLNLPKSVQDPKVPLLIVMDLKGSPHPVTDAELKPYLNSLLVHGREELAYSAWLQHLPSTKLQDLGHLYNPGFNEPTSELPFNWVITNPRFAGFEVHPRAGSHANKALQLNLGPGRIKFGEVRQVLMLSPGKYRLEGSLKGALKGRRGVRWQLRCGKRLKDVLGQSELLLGKGLNWTTFSVEFVVPNADTCRAQTLRLFHHARSASEELIFGELWFDDLRLTEVGDLAEGADG